MSISGDAMRELKLPDVYTITSKRGGAAPWHHEPLFAVIVALAIIAAGSLSILYWMVSTHRLEYIGWPLLMFSAAAAAAAIIGKKIH